MDFVYFVLLISVLIFIHEVGHFAFAKLFGVKVLTFSVGLGPSLLRLRGEETEYRLALIPIGGFVKMLEESQTLGRILPEDRPRTFEAQAAWKRVVIVLAGPVMNILFPIVLYTAVFLEDERALAPVVGVVLPGRPADGTLVVGDRIQKVNGKEVATFSEVQRIVARRAGQPTVFDIERDGKPLSLSLTPAEETEVRDLDSIDRMGRVGIAPMFPAPVLGIPRTDSPAYRAGLRTFDRIVAVNGRKIERWSELLAVLSANQGDTLVMTYLRPADVPRALGGLCDIAALEPGLATLTPLPRSMGVTTEASVSDARASDVLARTGIESSDMYVSFVPVGSSEWKAGLRAGDRIVALDGVPERLWKTMEEDLIRGAQRTRTLEWTRAGQPMAGTFQVRKEEWDDEFGQHYERFVFRTRHWAPNASPDWVQIPYFPLYAMRRGVEETGRVIRFISTGLLRVVQGKVSLSSMSGPITIYDIAGQAGAKGTTYFVWAMAMISVNLGLINLLPIPVLDGGHLLFFAIEAVSGRPVSMRVRELSTLAGMILLGLLMTVAFKNDISRHWDSIAGGLRSLLR